MNSYTLPFLSALVLYIVGILLSIRRLGRMNRSIRIRSGLFSVLCLALLFFADRLTKVYADRFFSFTNTETVIPGVIGYTYTVNSGAAWGILSRATWLLSLVSWVVVFICLYFLLFRPLHSPWLHMALILVTAGGLGNLYDRVMLGGVTDFLVFLFMRFPVFNLADSCITTGAGIAVIKMVLSPKDEPILLELTNKANGGAQEDAAK